MLCCTPSRERDQEILVTTGFVQQHYTPSPLGPKSPLGERPLHEADMENVRVKGPLYDVDAEPLQIKGIIERESSEHLGHENLGNADPIQAVRGESLQTSFVPMAPPPLMTSMTEGNGLLSSFAQLFSQREKQQAFLSVAEGLQHSYREKLLPMEIDSDFHRFHSPQLPDAYFASRPLILTIGQYSTGKTTFIRHLLDSDYPGQEIGPEPTTDRFVAVCHGQNVQRIPGNALVYDKNLPFTPLSAFGNTFLTRLECAQLPSPMLEGVTFIDTPGVLSGTKQRLKRGYDFEEVMTWFIEHASMVILFFDAHKLDISDEFQRCIASLNGCHHKVRIILNKADKMTTQQLMRVHGALMWSLGKVMDNPEVARVYVGSFWDEPLQATELRTLFEQEKCDLCAQIEDLPRNATVQKMNDLSKRARLAKAHALLLDHLRNAMPTLWGHAEAQQDLICRLPAIYEEVAREHGIPIGDFPDIHMMRAKLSTMDFAKFRKLDRSNLDKLEALLSQDVPLLLALLPHEWQGGGI